MSSRPDTSAWTSRLYQDEQDLEQMLDLLMQARSLTDDWHYALGDLLFNLFMVACHLHPQRHIHLWHDHARCVSTNNTPAIRLYESVGFQIVNQYLEYVRTE